jgi:hypothetical protein
MAAVSVEGTTLETFTGAAALAAPGTKVIATSPATATLRVLSRLFTF